MNKLFLNIALIATFGITSMHAMDASNRVKPTTYATMVAKYTTIGAVPAFLNDILNKTRVASMLDTTFKYAQNKYTEKLVGMVPNCINLKDNRVAQVAFLFTVTCVGYKGLEAVSTYSFKKFKKSRINSWFSFLNGEKDQKPKITKEDLLKEITNLSDKIEELKKQKNIDQNGIQEANAIKNDLNSIKNSINENTNIKNINEKIESISKRIEDLISKTPS